MILFKLHPTSGRNISIARKLTIKGNNYFIDTYTRKFLETYPDPIQKLNIYKGHDYFHSDEFNKHPIIEIE